MSIKEEFRVLLTLRKLLPRIFSFTDNVPINNFKAMKDSFDKYFLNTYVPGTMLGTDMSMTFISMLGRNKGLNGESR